MASPLVELRHPLSFACECVCNCVCAHVCIQLVPEGTGEILSGHGVNRLTILLLDVESYSPYKLVVGSRPDPDTRKQVPEEDRDVAADLKTIWNAEGIVQYSPIFYGYYGNANKIGQNYRLPLAYLVTGLAAFAFSFIVVLKTMAANSRQSRVSQSSDEEYIFAWKLFTEWDYMIASNETATTKHASITTTFKESILEEQEKAREGNKYLQIFLRVTANVIILILLATSTYIIQLFVERSRQLEVNKRNDPNFEPAFWDANELTVIMTLISTIFPNILDLISLMEKYHPRTSLRLMLARIFVLNLLNLYTLFIALYNKQNDLLASLEELQTNSTVISNCSSQLTTASPIDQSTTSLSLESSGEANTTCSEVVVVEESIASLCWETMIGQVGGCCRRGVHSQSVLGDHDRPGGIQANCHRLGIRRGSNPTDRRVQNVLHQVREQLVLLGHGENVSRISRLQNSGEFAAFDQQPGDNLAGIFLRPWPPLSEPPQAADSGLPEMLGGAHLQRSSREDLQGVTVQQLLLLAAPHHVVSLHVTSPVCHCCCGTVSILRTFQRQ
ncbi:hypothetical protein RRG08_052937 [Elysia crispata]|uniref:TMC domain-containing protein n=1 Tax=Elysia crispata TaxID=231223 RepID=A0AAE1BCV4_9GAST|nr:hypothetical protein RRG08_052937 [Elysia crispata]